MDLILRGANLIDASSSPLDIGIIDGRIVAIAPSVGGDRAVIDLGSLLVSPGFVETRIHLDKSCIVDQIGDPTGRLVDTIAAAAVAELAQPLFGFKAGRPTFTRSPAELHLQC